MRTAEVKDASLISGSPGSAVASAKVASTYKTILAAKEEYVSAHGRGIPGQGISTAQGDRLICSARALLAAAEYSKPWACKPMLCTANRLRLQPPLRELHQSLVSC